MNNLPAFIKEELSKLTTEQVMKFYELLSWSTAYGMPGCQIDPIACDRVLEMVKRMGSTPDRVIEPDRTVNHDWKHFPKSKLRE